MGKNRPHWRAPTGHGPANPAFVPLCELTFPPAEHLRCVAVARSTGQRCKRYAIQGAKGCPHHGGYGRGTLAGMRAYRQDIARLAYEKTGQAFIGNTARTAQLVGLSKVLWSQPGDGTETDETR